MVVEVMGRQSGWIAVNAGLAGGAEAILVPEEDYDLDDLARRLLVRHNSGRDYSIVIVAEGVPGPSGNRVTMGIDHGGFERLGGVSAVIAAELEARTGYETRVMILGHLQRGGTPTAFDRGLGHANGDSCCGGGHRRGSRDDGGLCWDRSGPGTPFVCCRRATPGSRQAVGGVDLVLGLNAVHAEPSPARCSSDSAGPVCGGGSLSPQGPRPAPCRRQWPAATVPGSGALLRRGR